MNHIHRKIWSTRLGAFVAVAETARGHGKQPGGAVIGAVAALSLWAAFPAFAASPAAGALPTNGTVTAGSASITQSGQAMTVTQGTQRAAINWQGFSIGKDASVTFAQPSANAVMLNRVTGAEQSVIDGAMRANGQVFLLNPNGVLFTSNARVDTAGLVASTRSLSDADFMAGRTTFAGNGAGSVVNAGQLTAADGGYVALIGRQVKNDGVIAARLGTVALASGDRVSLNFDGNSLVGVTVDRGTLDALVSNGGALLADGGTVLLKATAAEALLGTVVNNTGLIQAQSVGERNGKIMLLGDNGKVEVAGSLDASNHGQGSGGFIETSGTTLVVKDGTRITTSAAQGEAGTWLIDPTDFTISAGNGAPTSSGIGVNTLQTALGASNVTVQTVSAGSGSGDININAPLAWTANLLTLEAYGDINVNAVVSVTGTARLNLKTGYNFNTGAPTFDLTKTVRTKWVLDSNGNPSFVGRIDFDRTGTGILTINNSGYILINSLGVSGSTSGTDLQGINGNLSGKYALASDIDASASSSFASWGSGIGFNPIGRTAGFTGVLDGLGHVVGNYTLLASANNLGLVGQLNSVSAAVRNIGVTNINVGGDSPPNFGGLVGLLNAGSVSNAFATGAMASYAPQSGGLVGLAAAGTIISNSYTKVDLQYGAGDAGGLVGRAETGVIIRDSSASGNVYSPYGNNAGGLLGSSNGATVTNSSASGIVSGTNYVGGLVGLLEGVSLISSGHATGEAFGANAVGGLVGGIASTGSFATQILNSDSSGNVTATNSAAGGLVGSANGSNASVAAEISNSHAAGGTVTGPGLVGGLVGDLNVVNVTNSYADMTVVSSQSGSFWFAGLVGRARNMVLLSSYSLSDVDVTIGNGRYIGGLVGESVNGTYTNVYARGDVNGGAGGRWVGGLVGYNTATITNAYSTGQITGTTNIGGLIGLAAGGSVINSFWDVQTSGLGIAGSTTGSAGGIGRSTADMTSTATYTAAGWNFTLGTGIWARRDDINDKYPVLRAFGYTDRIATLLIDPTWLAGTDNSAVVYTTTGLLTGDSMTLNLTGGHLSYSTNLISGVGNYDGILVSSRATSGDLTVNRSFNWSDFKLSLEAAGNININSVLSATGTAQLDMKTGYNFNTTSPTYASGYRVNMGMDTTHTFTGRVDIDRTGTGILNINGQGYTLVNQLGSAGDEQLANGTLQGLDLSTNYALASNIDASATAGWNSGAGFTPIGAGVNVFTGKLEGLGHSISGLTISQPAPRDVSMFQVGLFGRADNASFSNLALTGVNITGPGQVGALLGATINNPSSIANVTVSGTVTGTFNGGGSGSDVGGLVGLINNAGTTIVNSHSTAAVTASSDNVGGLVGTSTGAIIDTSSATGLVAGSNAVGGLLGKGQTSTVITSSYATGTAVGQNGVGGLVGVLDSQSGANSISGSYATGNVTGNENVGGLVGDSPYSGTVIGLSFATGNVQAVRFVGGFIGTGNATITDAYATGNVTATDPSVAFAGGFSGGGAGTIILDRVYSSGVVTAADMGNSFGSGGLSGFGFYVVTNSFYDATKNPNGYAVNLGTGKTTAEMNSTATYQAAGWDFTFGSGGTWGRKDSLNNAYPVLKLFGYAESIVVDLGVSSRVYGDANPSLAGITITGCPTINCAGLITSVAWGTALDAATHAGGYALSGTNVLSYTYGSGASATMFDITYVIPTFTITPRVVTVTANSGATRVYDGTADAAGSLFTLGNLVNGDTVTLTGNGVLDSTHAGSRSLTSAGTLALSSSDYQIVGAPTGSVTVTPREISLTLPSNATRSYDGTTDAAAALFTVGNVVGSDNIGLTGNAVLDGLHVGSHSVTGLGSLSISNSDYVLATTTPSGTMVVMPKALQVSLVPGATKVFDGTTGAPSSQFSFSGLVGADQATLSGDAVLDGAGVGSHQVTGLGTLAFSNLDYQVAPILPTGSLAITPTSAIGPVLDLTSVISTAQRTLVLPDPNAVLAIPGTPSTIASASPNVVSAPPAISDVLGQSSQLLLLSAPSAEEPTESVTLTQARGMVSTSAGQSGNNQEVRVPVSRNSLAEIVNGGVRLPGGVDQVLFVVKAAK